MVRQRQVPSTWGEPRIRRAMFRLFQGPSMGPQGRQRCQISLPPLAPRQRPAYCGKPPEGLLEVPTERVKPGMESTAQVPCTLSLPGTPPHSACQTDEFRPSLGSCACSRSAACWINGQAARSQQLAARFATFSPGISYMCTCVL